MTLKLFAAFLFILSFLLTQVSYSQSQTWETFTDMKSITSIEVIPGTNTAYCASKGGLYVIDISNGAVLRKYTNITGLANISVNAIKLDDQNRIWAGGEDGSISVYDPANGTWQYIFDIKNSTEANKSIYDFALYGNSMFVATGYGVQNISTVTLRFNTAPYYQFGNLQPRNRVNRIKIATDKIYVATGVGFAQANLINSNLNDPTSWTTFNSSPLNQNVQAVEVYSDLVFVGSETGFMYFDGSVWFVYPNSSVSTSNIKYIKVIGNELFFVAGETVFKTQTPDLSSISQFSGPAQFNIISVFPGNKPAFGTNNNGVYHEVNSVYANSFPNGPFKNSFDDLSIGTDGILWAAAGDGDGGFYRFDGLLWENYNTTTHPEIGNNNFFRRIVSGDGIVWALSFGGGATKIIGDNIVNYNPSNSNLVGITGSPNFCVPFGGAFDINGRFWFTLYSSSTNQSLWTYNSDVNNFTGFSNPSSVSTSNLTNVAVDDFNTKWIVSSQSTPQGLYFFNENGNLNNPSVHIRGFYNLNDFPGGGVENVNDVIVDKNNEVWVATNNGVFILTNPRAAIQNPNQKPPLTKLRLISGNLSVPFIEQCRVISNDVLNQKWIGTVNNGVFHISSDGSTLISQYNINNSPILSNEITSIEVNPKDGKAYFGSLKGLSALQTSAIEPLAEFDEIICSPNPLLLPSPVDMRIDGLIENSKLMIMTLDGRIVDEFDSPGGKIATWNNSRNLNLASGVYIVVAFNKDGSQVGKGKFAVIKK